MSHKHQQEADYEVRGDLIVHGDIDVGGTTKIGAGTTTYTITNQTTDRAMDCDAAAAAEIADVLGTLIKDLRDQGIVTGTVNGT